MLLGLSRQTFCLFDFLFILLPVYFENLDPFKRSSLSTDTWLRRFILQSLEDSYFSITVHANVKNWTLESRENPTRDFQTLPTVP